jgi:hypothetical protein
MSRFNPYEHDQSSTVVINYQDLFQPVTFAPAVYFLFKHKLDLPVFHAKYRKNAPNRLAYDAAVLINSVPYKFILFKAIYPYYDEKNTRFEDEKTDRCQAHRRSGRSIS